MVPGALCLSGWVGIYLTQTGLGTLEAGTYWSLASLRQGKSMPQVWNTRGLSACALSWACAIADG